MNKQIIKNMLHDVIENPELNESLIRSYFSEDYIQQVDGKTLDFNDFFLHMSALKKSTKELSLTIESIAAEDDVVFTRHFVSGTTVDNKKGKSMVIAEFRIRNGKIYYCNELTHMSKGDESMRDLGSRLE